MRFIVAIFLLISINGFSQLKSFIISVKGDTLNRVDLKGRKQGPWVIHVDEVRGEQGYDEQGYFINDKKDGQWVRFSLMGDKIAEENYRWGALDGKCHYYNRTGALIRDESWRAVDPQKTMDTVDVFDVKDPTKVVDRVVVKLEGQTMKHGVWTYYEPDWGGVEKTETYFLDKLQTDNSLVDDELKPIDVSNPKNKSDTTTKKASTKPQVILDYEKKNSGKKKIKVRDGQTGGYLPRP
jgi:hypothetical protein